MDPSRQPRGRRHGVGLGLGLLAAFVGLWVLSRPDRQQELSRAASRRSVETPSPARASAPVLESVARDARVPMKPRGERMSMVEELATMLRVRVVDAKGRAVEHVQVRLEAVTAPANVSVVAQGLAVEHVQVRVELITAPANGPVTVARLTGLNDFAPSDYRTNSLGLAFV